VNFPVFYSFFVFKLLKAFTFFLFLQINRMVALIKQVYGVAEFNKHNGNIQWDVVADRCSYPKTPAQGANECGFYALRICATYGGDKIADNIKNQDVSVVLCFFRCIALCLFFTVFFCIPDCLPAAC
jgi:hypothetical protein